MKKIALIILCGLFFLTSQATQITVSNDPNRLAQYSNLQTAINDAADGDTLIVYSSAVSYGNVTVSKRLTIVGEGHFLCGNANKTIINIFTLLDAFGSEPDSSVFISLSIAAIYYNSVNVNGVRIERCNVAGVNNNGGSINGWIVINNIIGAAGIELDFGLDHLFSNNIFVVGSSPGIRDTNSNSNIFSNNLFIGGFSSPTTGVPFANFTNGTFNNNIIWGLTINSCSNCIFANNLTYVVASNGNISALNNLLDTNPQFVDYQGSDCDDFHLDVGSPAIGAGSSGEDLGIFGGNFVFEDIQNGLPPSPIITNFFLNNPVLENTTKLKFDVSAEKGKN